MTRLQKATALLLMVCALCSRAAAQTPRDADCLVVYTSHKAEVYEPIIREFESRTGLWVRLESGGTTEMLERIEAESGNPQCDLMFGGGVESLEAYRQLFAPVEMPGLSDASSDDRWLPFSSLPMVLIYNPKLTDAPRGWRDLTGERFAGRIAFADPSVSGSSYTALATLLQALPQKNALESFAHNLEGRVLEGSGDVVGAVASGECLVGVTLEETALKGMAAGYDIAMAYPEEGTSAVPDGVAVVAGAPHAQNARLFLEFILGDDLQARLSSKFYRRSVLDGSFDFPIVDYDIAWASAQKSAVLRRWAALIGEAKP